MIAKTDRFERIDRFAGFLHRLDIVFIPTRRDVRPTKSPAAAYGNQVRINPNLWLDRGVDVPDTSRVALAGRAKDVPTYTDITGAAGKILPGTDAQRDVAAPGSVSERCRA